MQCCAAPLGMSFPVRDLRAFFGSLPTSDPNPCAAPNTGEHGAPLTINQDDRTWAMLGHIAGLAGYLTGIGQYIGPLVIFILYKDKSKFVAFHALQSLFFQLAILVAGLLVVLIAMLTCVGGLLAIPLSIAAIVYPIVVGLKASHGEWHEYWLVGEWARRQVESVT